MELDKLFLQNIGDAPTNESVKNALEICNKEMVERMGDMQDEGTTINIFFGSDQDNVCYSNEFYEMMKFREVIMKYETLLPKRIGEVWIQQIADEVYDGYLRQQNEELVAQMTDKKKKSLEELCWVIENIYNTKGIYFMTKDPDGLSIKLKLSLDHFEKPLDSLNYFEVKNQIIKTMGTGGILFVVAGSEGLTPQRVHGFIVYKDGWKKCQREFQDLVRDLVIKKKESMI